ncbi:MAG: MATE family efflux transporter, partial [Ruminiclostridium sp.]|nr:MATE family efflux transporter [Ruminiclostridium sp.]
GLEFVIFLIIYIRSKPDFAVNLTELFRVKWKLFLSILKKGLPVLFCEMVWVMSETITTAIYNGRGGADVVSGMAASFVIGNLFFVAFGGIYSATGVILGKTLGRGELETARSQKTWLLSGSAVFGMFMLLFGLATLLLIPVVFGKLSESAVTICRDMVIMMSLFMPVWVYMNAQQAVARAGGDTAMGAITDSGITIFVMLPMLFILGFCTDIGPVMMYLGVKLLDFVKVAIFHIWLKKERWLRNLTAKNN